MRTFRMGGIHPQANKLSAGRPIQMIPLPESVMIPLNQHIGAPSTAIVAKGDKVKAGTRIGKADGFVSANVHSSVSGIVTKIGKMPDGAGILCPAVLIKTEGDEWEPAIDCSERIIRECNLTSNEIIQKIETAGIVGMGGAAFPTKVKLSPPPGAKADVLLINAVECEPYLTSDHALMLEKGEQIIVGTTILMKALNVGRTVIGIEANKLDAIEVMSTISKGYAGIDIVPLKVKYPQGSEKQLIEAVLHRQVKSGAFPISVGTVVQNVGTVYAVYEAVQKNKPLIERVITVTGKGLLKPSNFLARIGTPIRTLINAAGGLPENTGKIIGGGPMMGKALVNIDSPVMKGSSGILLMTTEESLRRPMHDCIRCTKCIQTCPMGLEPHLLMNLTEHKLWDYAEKNHIPDCIECGVCAYSCPANRPLLDYIRQGKSTVAGIVRAGKS